MGPLLEAVGPLGAVLGLVLDLWGVVLNLFCGSIRRFDASLRFNHAICLFDSLIGFVSFVNSLSTQQLDQLVVLGSDLLIQFIDSIER